MSSNARRNPSSPTSISTHADSRDQVTWLDFLRTTSDASPSGSRPRQTVTGLVDRRRRHTDGEPERRSSLYPPHSLATSSLPLDRTTGNEGNITGAPTTGHANAASTASPSSPVRPTTSIETGNRVFRDRNRSDTSFDRYLQRRESDTLLPRWQPDSEVPRCPVCGTDFSFWYRKHHCRKCGRVVCAACSPHRITIPRQYIVHPPYLYGDDVEPAWAIGGGEVVRVCNPCVPDPWTPGTISSPRVTSPSSSPDPNTPLSFDSRRRHLQHQTDGRARHSIPSPAYGHNRSQTHTAPFHAIQHAPQVHPSFPDGLPSIQEQNRGLEGPRRQHGASQSLDHGRGVFQSVRTTAGILLGSPPIGSPPRGSPSSPSTGPPESEQPRREIREEDECPVCGTELPPGESIREAHVLDCISTRFASASLPRSQVQFSSASSTPASIAEPSTAAAPWSSPPEDPLTSGAMRPRATSYRPRGIAVYRATEKDCLNEDGDTQECIICFEEFQPGDEMGRMECLCKFHRICIRRWWDAKGHGCCPTHQLHE